LATVWVCNNELPTWASAEIFPGEAERRRFAYSFYVADDSIETDLHKTLYPFHTAKKIPHESMRSICIFFEILLRWCVRRSGLPKGCAFCHLLQLLLNWAIIQYPYYCELQTTEYELGLNYPQRLRCSH